MEKYGFVYIWRDKKRNRYYIGSHWGTEDDGYICSSNRMRNAYRRRKEDFKRRILLKVYTNRKDLLEEEFKWLQLAENKKERYYNLKFFVTSAEFFSKKSIEKIKNALKNRKLSEEHKLNISIGQSGKKNHMFGKKYYNNGIESRPFIPGKEPAGWISGRIMPWASKAANNRKNVVAAKSGKDHFLFGKKHSIETRMKMSKSQQIRYHGNIN